MLNYRRNRFSFCKRGSLAAPRFSDGLKRKQDYPKLILFQGEPVSRSPTVKLKGGIITVSCAFMQNSLCLVLIWDWSFSTLLYLPGPQPSHFPKHHREHRHSKGDTKIHMDSNKTKSQFTAFVFQCSTFNLRFAITNPSVMEMNPPKRRPKCRRTRPSAPGSAQPV